VAQLSYSFYLVHEMLFEWLFPKLAPLFVARIGAYGTMALDSVIGLAFASTLAAVLYVTIERPSMRMRSHPVVLSLIESLMRTYPRANAREEEQPETAPA
jgi:peptidoglycan/LPS O-acetylase OafA/YrhL